MTIYNIYSKLSVDQERVNARFLAHDTASGARYHREKEQPQEVSCEAASSLFHGIHSVVDLTEQVGAITPEEHDTLSRVNFDADPTPQELEALGPDFAQRVIDRTTRRLPTDKPGAKR
jgi:hypothetical protein